MSYEIAAPNPVLCVWACVCECVCVCMETDDLGVLINFHLLNLLPTPAPALSFQKTHLDNHHSPPIQKICCPVSLCFTEEYQLQVGKSVPFASTVGCWGIAFLKCVNFQMLAAYVSCLFMGGLGARKGRGTQLYQPGKFIKIKCGWW